MSAVQQDADLAEAVAIHELPTGSTRAHTTKTSAVVPVDAQASRGQLRWSKTKVYVQVGGVVTWNYHSDVTIVPHNFQLFHHELQGAESTVINVAVHKATAQGECYGVRFNEEGVFLFHTTGGNRTDEEQQVFEVVVRSSNCCRRLFFSVNAIPLYVLLVFALAGLIVGCLVLMSAEESIHEDALSPSQSSTTTTTESSAAEQPPRVPSQTPTPPLSQSPETSLPPEQPPQPQSDSQAAVQPDEQPEPQLNAADTESAENASDFATSQWCYADDCCNGLASLCQRRYDLAVSAMSHNAYSSSDSGFSLPNHKRGIPTSLLAGVRGLMLDLVTPRSGPTKLCHRHCWLGEMDLAEAFGDVHAFLRGHPNEVITLVFEQTISSGRSKREQFDDVEAALSSTGLAGRLHEQAPTEPWPTLGAMRGKVVVFNYLHDPEHEWPKHPAHAGRARKWNHHAQSFMASNHYSYDSAAALMDKSSSCTIHRGHSSSPLYLLNHFVTSPSAKLSSAREVNHLPEMRRHPEDCMGVLAAPGAASGTGGRAPRVPNFLAVDFWSQGDVVSTALMLNDAINASDYEPAQLASSYFTYDGGSEDQNRYVRVQPGGGVCIYSDGEDPESVASRPGCSPGMWSDPDTCQCKPYNSQCLITAEPIQPWCAGSHGRG